MENKVERKCKYIRVHLNVDFSTDGDFVFDLIPTCMTYDGNEGYEINLFMEPYWNDTTESFEKRVVDKLTFILKSLNEHISGKDGFMKYSWPRFTDAINKCVFTLGNSTKSESISECVFSGNQECYLRFSFVKFDVDNPEKSYNFLLKENTFIKLQEKCKVYGNKNLDEHLHTCWDFIDKLWKENQELRLK